MGNVIQFDRNRRLGRCYQTISEETRAYLKNAYVTSGPDSLLLFEVGWHLGIEHQDYDEACKRKYNRSFLYMFFSIVGKPVGDELTRQLEWDKMHGRQSEWLELEEEVRREGTRHRWEYV